MVNSDLELVDSGIFLVYLALEYRYGSILAITW